jgi:uncharacterized protein YecE (DUF72 family)
VATIVGTAGWSIPTVGADRFPAEGSSLERYASHFSGTEINSSFHRSHRASTWRRWAESVPDAFRFSAKVPKTITHKQKLVDCEALLNGYLAEAGALGEKLALHLVQLPPSLAFDAELVGSFFGLLRNRTAAALACEPRHASWFEAEADALLDQLQVARVAADPALAPAAAVPGGWRGVAYFRLHGSPARYRSSYEDDRLQIYARQIEAIEAEDVWCIFDNTASSAATGNALSLIQMLEPACTDPAQG